MFVGSSLLTGWTVFWVGLDSYLWLLWQLISWAAPQHQQSYSGSRRNQPSPAWMKNDHTAKQQEGCQKHNVPTNLIPDWGTATARKGWFASSPRTPQPLHCPCSRPISLLSFILLHACFYLSTLPKTYPQLTVITLLELSDVMPGQHFDGWPFGSVCCWWVYFVCIRPLRELAQTRHLFPLSHPPPSFWNILCMHKNYPLHTLKPWYVSSIARIFIV
jgi:hypothetical protein